MWSGRSDARVTWFASDATRSCAIEDQSITSDVNTIRRLRDTSRPRLGVSTRQVQQHGFQTSLVLLLLFYLFIFLLKNFFKPSGVKFPRVKSKVKSKRKAEVVTPRR